MTTLILAGEAIVAASDFVSATPDGWQTPGAVYPRAAGVTGIASVETLPGDFSPARYVWRGGALVRLPDPEPPPPPVPASVARWRARAALRMAGLLEAVEATIAAGDVATQEWWAAGLEMERADPRVNALAAGLGLSSKQIDDLFRQAAAL